MGSDKQRFKNLFLHIGNFMQKIKVFLIIWVVVLFANQIFIFRSCFSLHCVSSAVPHTLIISAILYYIFYYKSRSKDIDEEPPAQVQPRTKKATSKSRPVQSSTQWSRPKSINQEKGDAYEKYIGKKFEEKDNIVIYNGFIKGYEDKGIDIVALSKEHKVINLVQCKNWTRKPMTLDDIKNIYYKLNVHYNNLDLYYLPTSEIYKHTQHDNLSFIEFDDTLNDLRSNIDTYKIRKTLYVASENVIDLEIGKHLTMIKTNIYRYQEMKIVIEGM